MLDPRRVAPAERREVDDAGVEPRVAHLDDAFHLPIAGGAADAHAVDPGTVQLLQLVETRDGTLLQLRPRTDHVHVPAFARIERKRQTEVALARDVPVAHVAQPVVHPLLVLRRRPFDGRVGVEHRLTDLLRGDEPVVDDAKDERRLATPADRIAVDDRAFRDEDAALAQRFGHPRGHLVRREAGELAVRRQHAPCLVDRREHRQVVNARELEVLGARARRDVDDAGSLLQ